MGSSSHNKDHGDQVNRLLFIQKSSCVFSDARRLGQLVRAHLITADTGDRNIDWRRQCASRRRWTHDGCLRGRQTRGRIRFFEEPRVKHPCGRNEKQDEGNSHWPGLFRSETKYKENRKEYGTEEHHLRRASNALAPRRHRFNLCFVALH